MITSKHLRKVRVVSLFLENSENGHTKENEKLDCSPMGIKKEWGKKIYIYIYYS